MREKVLKLIFIADINKPFLSKEKATSYLRSKRVKRDINEECSETEGCWHEEIVEIGVSDVVNIIIYTIKRRWQYNGSTIEDKYYLYLVKSFQCCSVRG